MIQSVSLWFLMLCTGVMADPTPGELGGYIALVTFMVIIVAAVVCKIVRQKEEDNTEHKVLKEKL
jgi:hypothetical protein